MVKVKHITYIIWLLTFGVVLNWIVGGIISMALKAGRRE